MVVISITEKGSEMYTADLWSWHTIRYLNKTQDKKAVTQCILRHYVLLCESRNSSDLLGLHVYPCWWQLHMRVTWTCYHLCQSIWQFGCCGVRILGWGHTGKAISRTISVNGSSAVKTFSANKCDVQSGLEENEKKNLSSCSYLF